MQVAVIIGELIGRFANEWFMNMGIKRNKGVFEAETRLWYGIVYASCLDLFRRIIFSGNLQGVLYCHAIVSLRIPCTRCLLPKEVVRRSSCYGLGTGGSCSHDKHSGSL